MKKALLLLSISLLSCAMPLTAMNHKQQKTAKRQQKATAKAADNARMLAILANTPKHEPNCPGLVSGGCIRCNQQGLAQQSTYQYRN